jgi:hypothetical protein
MTERVKRLVAGNTALTRLADSYLLGLIEPDGIAQMALYLASDESRMTLTAGVRLSACILDPRRPRRSGRAF